jgi:phenylacetic acid degradation operon negative regulatory protein
MGYRTQDLIFTLYGDYIVSRGGEAWIGSIITLMAELDTSAQAVRSTLSRMTRNGWLRSRREGRHSFYAITAKTKTLLTEGARRIYEPRQDPWDKRWYVLNYSIPEDQRHLRHRLRQRLIWLGFGRLGPASWVSPRDLRQDVIDVAKTLGVSDQIFLFSGEFLGTSEVKTLVDHCWGLKQLNQAYQDFVKRHRPDWDEFKQQAEDGSINPHAAFKRRFLLVHEYRSFPYVDPNLPPELLPEDWLGNDAIHFFQTYAALLASQANAYVDDVMAAGPGNKVK